MRGRPFRLVREEVSRDTVEALEDLLGLARSGKVIGVAFAAMRRGRTYFVHAAGEAHRSPTWSRGMIAALDDDLRDQLRGDAP